MKDKKIIIFKHDFKDMYENKKNNTYKTLKITFIHLLLLII
jgi:hypothetical protein